MPASLGNGLVYDARYMLLGRPRVDPEDPVALESQLASQQQKGFRPVQLDIKPFWDEDLDVMRWDLPEYFPTLIADEDANHLVEVVRELDATAFQDDYDDRMLEGGWRPLSVVPYMADLDGTQLYSAIWVRDGWNGGWAFLPNTPPQALYDWFMDPQNAGYRPISLEGGLYWNDVEGEYERRFTVVAVSDEIGAQGSWDLGWDLEGDVAFENDVVDKAIAGYVPFYVSTSHTFPEIVDTETHFQVLYVPRPPVVDLEYPLEVFALSGLTDSEMHEENQFRRSEGYHLVSFASYRNDGDVEEKLYVGIWHRYRRDRWVETVAGDISAAGEEFQPLEDTVRNLMRNASATVTNIPAAQLAVMKGDELVLSRAYTRAPIAYAPITNGTPLMAASIAKPVTAVATVKAFGVSGLTDDLMDLVPDPVMPGGTKPEGITVRDALQHTSGWAMPGTALTVKGFIGEDRLPTSMDWLEYMAQLDDHGTIGAAPQNFRYSNFGFNMLALALKEEASIDPHDPFNEYESVLMEGEIFGEVGMCRTSYKRQGLVDSDGMAWPLAEPEYGACTRNCLGADGLARYYLTEDAHPYFDDLEHAPLANPAGFEASALDDVVPAPAFVRRGSYGGGNAVQAHIGGGALVSTAEDLARFMVSFRPYFTELDDTTLLTSSQASAMFPAGPPLLDSTCSVTGRVTTGPAAVNKTNACYSLGWFVGSDGAGNTDVWNHGGDVDGAVGALMYHPETDTTVAVLFARHPFSANWLVNDVLDQQLDDIAASGFLPPEPIEIPPIHDDYDPPGYPGF